MLGRGRIADHLIDHRGYVDQDRGSMATNLLEDDFRRWMLGKQHRTSTYRERKQQIGSGRITEEKLGYRKRDVVLPVPDAPDIQNARPPAPRSAIR